MTEFSNLVNNAGTVVSTNYTAGSGELEVANASIFGTNFPLRISVRRGLTPLSILKVTDINDDILTIDGSWGSLPDVNLLTGDVVEVLITAETITTIQDALNDVEDSVGDLDDASVHVTGNESIAGLKTFTETLTIDLGSDVTGLVVQGDASQTASLNEWRNSSGTALWKIDGSGNMVGNATSGGLATGGFLGIGRDNAGVGLLEINRPSTSFSCIRLYSASTDTMAFGKNFNLASNNSIGFFSDAYSTTIATVAPVSGDLTVVSGSASITPWVVKGASSQTANLQEWQSSDGSAKAWVTKDGSIVSDYSFALNGSAYYAGNNANNNYLLWASGSPNSLLTAANAAHIPLVIKGTTSQTANLTEWQNSSDTVLSSISKDGYYGFGIAPTSPVHVSSGTSGKASIVIDSTNPNYQSFVECKLSTNGYGYRVGASNTTGPDFFVYSTQSSHYFLRGGYNNQAVIIGPSTTQLSGTSDYGANSAATLIVQDSRATGTTSLVLKAAMKTATVTNKELTSNVATITTSADHGFINGRQVLVSGVDATFNGTHRIIALPTTTSFSYSVTASDVASIASSGTAVGDTQTANLTSWQNATGTVLASIGRAGNLTVSGSTSLTPLLVKGIGVAAYNAAYCSARFIADPGTNQLIAFECDNSRGETTLAFTNSANSAASKLRVAVGGYSDWVTEFNPTGVIFGGITTPAGQVEVRTADAARKALVVKGFTSQTANLQEWQNSSASVLARVNSLGQLIVNNTVSDNSVSTVAVLGNIGFIKDQNYIGINAYLGGSPVDWRYLSNNHANVMGNDGSGKFGIYNAPSGTAGNAITWTERFTILTGGTVGINKTSSHNGQLHVASSAVGTKGLVVQGIASQTANLQEWQDSNSNILGLVNTSGKVVIGRNYSINSVTQAHSLFTSESVVYSAGIIVSAGYPNTLVVPSLGTYGASGVNGIASNVSGGRVSVGVHGYSAMVNLNAGSINYVFGVYGLAESGPEATDGFKGTMIGVKGVAQPGTSGLFQSGANLYGGHFQVTGGTNAIPYGLYVNNTTPTTGYGIYSNAGLNQFNTGNAGVVGLVVKGAASQTASLQEWQNSSGSAVALVGSEGQLLLGTGTSYDSRFFLSVAPVFADVNNTAVKIDPLFNTGSSGSGSCIYARPSIRFNSSLTSLVGCWIRDAVNSGGTIPSGITYYGLKIDDLVNPTLKYSIFTGLGAIQFGDTTSIVIPSAATKGLIIQSPATLTKTINNVALTSNVATITTSADHGFIVGVTAVITGLTNTALNGSYTVASVPSTTTFTFAKTNADITSVADSGTVVVSQTANLTEWQNGSGTSLTKIDSSQRLLLSGDYGQNNALAVTNSNASGYAAYLDGKLWGCYVYQTGSGTAFQASLQSATAKGLVVQGAASQTANLAEFQDNSGAALMTVKADGSIKLVSLDDSSATNESLYYSTTQSKVVWKDASGVANPLY